MAVDTRDRRFSMMGLLQPVPSVFPNPDGTISTQDRAQYIFMYHGIDLDPLVQLEVGTWFERQRGRITGTQGVGRGTYHTRNFR